MRVLDAVELLEVSPVLVGANRAAHSLTVRGQAGPPWKREMRRAYARYVLQPEIRELERQIAQQEELQRLAAASRVRDRQLDRLLGQAG